MRVLILGITAASLLGTGCVVDKRGESATSQSSEAIATHSQQLSEAASVTEELNRRTSQMEEVLAYQGERSEVELEDMDSVRRELRSLRGGVDQLQHSSAQSQSSMDSFQEDIAARVAALEQSVATIQQAFGLSGVATPVAESVEGAPESIGESTAEAEDGEEAGEEAAVEEEGVIRGGGVDIVAQGVVEESSNGGDDPLVVAERAIAEGHPRVARAILERVIREGGEQASTPEVLYRLADTWFAEGLYEQAGLRFQTVVEQGAGGSWAAWAMVRQGECFQHLGDNAGASFFWEDVLREYPGSEASELAQSLLGR
jgi:TolA-binding protein